MQFLKHNITKIIQFNVYTKKNCHFFNLYHYQNSTCQTNLKKILLKSFTSIRYLSNISADIQTNVKINNFFNRIQEETSSNLKLLSELCKTTDFRILSTKESNLLLKSCGSLTYDSPRKSRDAACQTIYTNLVKLDKLDLSVYKTYILVCTENDVVINSDQFLASLNCEPDIELFKLLLRNVCKNGNVSSAFALLAKMKDMSFPADEDVFNSLVLASTIDGGIKSGETVLKTMRTAQISETPTTTVALLKGLIIRGDRGDFEKICNKINILTESLLLEVVEYLGLTENHQWIDQIERLHKRNVSREFIDDLKKLCIHLIHMTKPVASFTIWKKIVSPSFEEKYGLFLLKEMLHYDANASDIFTFAKDLYDNELNPYILESLTEIALVENRTDQARTFLKNLPRLRQHYFWPLLCNAGKKNDETNMFDILEEMRDLKVKLDHDALDCYVLRYCDLSDVKRVINKLQNVGYSLKDIISPMLFRLLRMNKVKEAVDISKMYDDVDLFGDQFIILLTKSWAATKDSASILYLLKKFSDSKKDKNILIAEFTIKSLKSCNHDYDGFTELLEGLKKHNLKITYDSSEILQKLSMKVEDPTVRKNIIMKIDSLIDENAPIENRFIPLPKEMDIEQLECHLIELQQKGLNTRGVLRHLIRLHTNQGNNERVAQLYEQLQSQGYNDSPGIKSSLMHNYVMSENADAALNIYKDLKTLSSSFNLDTFKIIDLASLLISTNRFTEAQELLSAESRNLLGGKPVERNCIKLLSACQTEDELNWCFNVLVKSRCCKPTEHILAPLVRFQAVQNNLDKMVEAYVECATKYRCTPLQSLVFSAVLKAENEELLSKIVKATEAIHGKSVCHIVLIAALSENGQEKALRKLLIQNPIPVNRLSEKQCQKWVNKNKLNALKTLAAASRRIPKEILDEVYVNKCIMRIYDLQGNVEAAIKYFESINEESLSSELENEYLKIIKKYDKIPVNVTGNKN